MSTQNRNQTHLKEEAIALIDEYISLTEKPWRTNMRHSLAFPLHVLLRTGKGEDYGFKTDEVEFFKIFIECLQSFFVNPTYSAALIEQTEFDAETIAERFERLRRFFEDLQEDHYMAELEKYNLEYYAERMTDKELRNMKVIYERMIELEKSRRAILEKYYDRIEI